MDMLGISGLYKRFGDKIVLNGLDLAVPEHSIFGFIGKNGAGKTTTMKAVLGLLKADSGEIVVNGEKVVCGQTATNRYIGYLPDVPEFYPFICSHPNVLECSCVTGHFAMHIKVAFDSTEKLDAFIGDLQKFGSTETQIVFSTPCPPRGVEIEKLNNNE